MNNTCSIVVDIEADGPVPGLYSMVCFGAVCVEDPTKTFYAQCAPISEDWDPEALAISGFTRVEHESFGDPGDAMFRFRDWINDIRRDKWPIFWADNNGFDWSFINYYFHLFVGKNPFGWSSRNIIDLYRGLEKNLYAKARKHRKTKHDHNPVNDAMGMVEVLRHIDLQYNLGIIPAYPSE